jgi:cyclopropane-fatty-acyl-phospholipid synthase
MIGGAGDIEAFLRRVIHSGRLEVILPSGRRLVVGDDSDEPVVVRLTDTLSFARIIAQPYLGVGEAYMDGRLIMERGEIRDLLELGSRNFATANPGRAPGPLGRWWRGMRQDRNARAAARRNVAHHYDLSVELYRRFLDDDLQYSCAYFARPGASLDEAQAAKKRHIAAKLDLRAGQTVLDIGSGWGGLAISLAGWAEVGVDGITLSTEQLKLAKARAEAAGLGGRVKFALTDYRDVAGRYDRIVSVGMFEHVGRANYRDYFEKVAALLADDGVAVIHSIGSSGPPGPTNPFTTKYIFPGAYVPSLSEVLPAIERAGLRVTDIEIQRLHYAETLRLWQARFAAHREEIAALYDERFCRMWECYLAGAEMGFVHGGHMIFQLQLSKRVDALPITRDYMAQAERGFTMRAARAA